ncbi:unnamed protein product [Echinostoma caproni]|uniref:Uncharacterized protein n=1 Tax=Echinostoma caproni TaxID=27848 RepID=A0A183AUF4_9TREM|nr:unnamed protein product [Echinostoma caproni]
MMTTTVERDITLMTNMTTVTTGSDMTNTVGSARTNMTTTTEVIDMMTHTTTTAIILMVIRVVIQTITTIITVTVSTMTMTTTTTNMADGTIMMYTEVTITVPMLRVVTMIHTATIIALIRCHTLSDYSILISRTLITAPGSINNGNIRQSVPLCQSHFAEGAEGGKIETCFGIDHHFSDTAH